MSPGTLTTACRPSAPRPAAAGRSPHLASATTAPAGFRPRRRCGRPPCALVDARQRPVAAFATQTLRRHGDRRGCSPDRDGRDYGARRGIDRLHRPVELVGDPDGVPADRDRRRPTSDRDRGDGAGGLIDADDEVRLAVGEPRAAEALRHRSRRDFRVDPAQHPPTPSIESCQVPGARRDDDRVALHGERSAVARVHHRQPPDPRDDVECRVDLVKREGGIGRARADGPEAPIGSREALRGPVERDRGHDPPRRRRDSCDGRSVGIRDPDRSGAVGDRCRSRVERYRAE